MTLGRRFSPCGARVAPKTDEQSWRIWGRFASGRWRALGGPSSHPLAVHLRTGTAPKLLPHPTSPYEKPGVRHLEVSLVNFWIVRLLPPADEESPWGILSVVRRAQEGEIPASLVARLDQREMDPPRNVDPALHERGIPEWVEFAMLGGSEGLILMASLHADVGADEGDLTGKTWPVTFLWDSDGEVTDS